jgi:hypothetical protein
METYLWFSPPVVVRGTLLDENGVLKSVFNLDVIKSLEAAQVTASPPVKPKSPFKRFSAFSKAPAPPPPSNPAEDIVISSTKSLVLPRTMMQDFFRDSKVSLSETVDDISQLFVDEFDAQKPLKEYTQKERTAKLNKLKGKHLLIKKPFWIKTSIDAHIYHGI